MAQHDRGDTWTRTSNVNQDGINGCNPFDGRNWALEIDPDDPDHVLTTNGFGCFGSGWQSFDGGVTWDGTMSEEFLQSINMSGVYDIAFDPSDSDHILMTFHDRWGSGASGVAESTDDGRTWVAHQPQQSWGAGHYIHFLDNSDSWLLATQEDGLWRTTSRGADWREGQRPEHVARDEPDVPVGEWHPLPRHGERHRQVERRRGQLVDRLRHAVHRRLRRHHRRRQPPVHGAGQHRPVHVRRGVLLLSAGVRRRRLGQLGSQTFSDGPMNFAIDPISRTIYSSNWNGGIWRLSY